MQNQPLADRPELLPLGQDGIVIRFALASSAAATGAVQALTAALPDCELEGVIEIAPSLASVLIRFDPLRVTRAELAAKLTPFLARHDWYDCAPPAAARRWVIPAAFGGTDGPQLGEAAEQAGMSERAAIAEITAQSLRVLAIGFAPGQPYLGLMPKHWDIPRQPELTPRVPAGAVIQAIRQLVLFTNESATGWRHIGQSAFRPFLQTRTEPFLLRPGDAVVFEQVSTDTLRTLEANNADGTGGARCEALP